MEITEHMFLQKHVGEELDNRSAGIDHDRLFKELLETFFAEFMELFFPDIYQHIDFNKLHFLEQEIFTDVTAGEKHFIDLLAETRLKGEDGIILVHVESQAQYQAHFAERMFIYFSRLYQKHCCRILPIAIFNYDQIKNEPSNFHIKFPFLHVLDFNFHIVELKKKNWQEYIKSNYILGVLAMIFFPIYCCIFNLPFAVFLLCHKQRQKT
jgi:hypothetical protein